MGTVVVVVLAIYWLVPIGTFPMFPRLLIYGILGGTLAVFIYSWRSLIRSGGQWVIYVRDRVLHVDFPGAEGTRSFEISIDSITAIEETRTKSWADGASIIRSIVRLRTRELPGGHILPEPLQVKTTALLKVLKELRPDLPHNITDGG